MTAPRPDLASLPALFRRHLCQTSTEPLGLEVVEARGATLVTRDGRRYIDLIAGIAVNNVGHAHPAVVAAMVDQANRYLHAMVYGEYVLEPQVRLAARLAGVLPEPLSVVYFTNSGAEAMEGALKLAKKRTGRAGLVAFERSYHGDTHGALSVTGREVYQAPFRPLLPEVRFLPFDDVAALDRIDHTAAAVIVEPVQGEGGVRVPGDAFLPTLRRRCDAAGALLIFDEVQTGFGRTGRLFASERWNVVPDVMVLAKALGGGMPLGAFVGAPELMECLRDDPPLSHVTTFGGHPVCCAAGLASLEVIMAQGLSARAERLGGEVRGALREMGQRHGGIREVRGLGLMIGVEMESGDRTARFVARALELGALVGWTLHSDRVVRVAPPLNISEAELAAGLAALEQALQDTA
jgi:acetylornithine/succinyldiaminopimelate/putrescine aminotransferase